MNRKDWRTISLENVGYDPLEFENQLAPVVRNEFLGNHKTDEWAKQLISECRRKLEVVLPLKNKRAEIPRQAARRGADRTAIVNSRW